MIQSMTGYGKAVVAFKEKKINVEVKSLNSKQLDLNTRIAPLYREKEMEIRQMVAEAVIRGKVDMSVWIEKDTAVDATPINAALVENYFQQMKSISDKTGIPMPEDCFYTLLRMPDVLTKTETEILDEEEWLVVREAVKEALKNLVDFRTQEGAALQKKFAEKIDNIACLLAEIEPFEKSRVERIKARIIDGLQQIPGVEYDKNRLEQELIYYIEKLDISEEKQRLANHLKYFRDTMNEPAGQGKKLGFIAQEMGREINTTGSKSNQAEMQNIVVKMKDELEQIKEQVLNAHKELNLAFSISCTSRAPRGTEQNGVEYFFLTPEEFRTRIEDDEFLEYEEVYTDRFYGTLKSQVEKQLAAGQNVVFDVDVKGGVNIKKFYGDEALSIFIQPPSVNELRRRLEARATDAPDVIDQRIARAEFELTFADKFDKVVVNDILEYAEADALSAIQQFLAKD